MMRALCIALLLAGCDGGDNYTTAKADRDTTLVTVNWLQQEDVNKVCHDAGFDGGQVRACAAVASNTCTIYAVQPNSFNDRPTLQTLGHEAWHCFGATHR